MLNKILKLIFMGTASLGAAFGKYDISIFCMLWAILIQLEINND